MSKQLIFIVHGVGEQMANWSNPAVTALKKHYKDFKLPGAFADRYDVKEILYGQPFTEYWDKHDDVASALGDLAVPSEAFTKAVLSLATKVPKDKLRSHFGDVYLYLSTFYNELIALDVNIKIEKELLKQEFPTYSIIAHSLGTRITFDTLQRSFSKQSKYTMRAKPRVLMMVADITRLSSFHADELQVEHGLRVYPSNSSKKGACQHYISVNHPLDPIAVIRKYQPEFRDDPNYHEPDIELTDVTSKDIHSLQHYCLHPAVAAAFYNQIMAPEPFGPDPVSASTLKGALKKYREGTLGGNLDQLREQVKVLEPTKARGWEATVDKIAQIYGLIDEFNA